MLANSTCLFGMVLVLGSRFRVTGPGGGGSHSGVYVYGVFYVYILAVLRFRSFCSQVACNVSNQIKLHVVLVIRY